MIRKDTSLSKVTDILIQVCNFDRNGAGNFE